MIESRYKIEYVFPDEDQAVKKASPFRVLWYLLLIPLIGLIVAAITYDFSIKDISRDSLVLFEKAKVQIFNLGDHQESNNLEKKSNILVKTPIDKITPEVNKKQTVSINLETPIATMDRYKTKITELTSKQQAQLESIQKQIKENSELSIKLNKLSEQFVLEQVKNEKLNSQLAEQEKDRLELEEQLNKILEKTVAASDASSDNTSTNEPLEKKVTLEKPVTKLTKEVIIASEDKITESKDAVLTQLKKVVKTPDKTEKTEQSETDKIIQAMTTIIEETSNETTQKVITTIELEKQPKSEVVTKKEEVNNTKDESNKSVQKNNEDSSSIASILPSKTTAKENELTSTTKVENLGNTLVKKESITGNNPELQEKMATKAVTDTNKVSPVDAIIAAMEESESQSNNGDSQDSSRTNQSIDSKLENDIKQQLVEKGEIEIDK